MGSLGSFRACNFGDAISLLLRSRDTQHDVLTPQLSVHCSRVTKWQQCWSTSGLVQWQAVMSSVF
eukprot:scaffold5611_cov140-Skeletonema_menzelii.AAC.4